MERTYHSMKTQTTALVTIWDKLISGKHTLITLLGYEKNSKLWENSNQRHC